jgi:hypothetical protein
MGRTVQDLYPIFGKWLFSAPLPVPVQAGLWLIIRHLVNIGSILISMMMKITTFPSPKTLVEILKIHLFTLDISIFGAN